MSAHAQNCQPRDLLALRETASVLVDALLLTEPAMYASPSSAQDIAEALTELLRLQLPQRLVSDVEMDECLHEAIWNHNLLIAPKRSYRSTFVRKQPDQPRIASKLAELRATPQPAQRTEAWYAFRKRFITASSAWKVFGSQAQRNQLIFDKCDSSGPTSARRGTNVLSPLHWGQKYEPVSVMLYERDYHTTVGDFGCIPHPTLGCLAASPDGINDDRTSSRYGRMLEIKNVVSREINGIPKREYWIQMQLQMAVCGLRECDFLETQFKEYDSAEEFWSDGDATRTSEGKSKGLMVQFLVDGAPEYAYAPLDLKRAELEEWRRTMLGRRHAQTWVADIWWRLETSSCVLVLQNREWFRWAAGALEDTWGVVLKERVTGHLHRAPKKRLSQPARRSIAQEDDRVPTGRCFLDGPPAAPPPSLVPGRVETQPLSEVLSV